MSCVYLLIFFFFCLKGKLITFNVFRFIKEDIKFLSEENWNQIPQKTIKINTVDPSNFISARIFKFFIIAIIFIKKTFLYYFNAYSNSCCLKNAVLTGSILWNRAVILFYFGTYTHTLLHGGFININWSLASLFIFFERYRICMLHIYHILKYKISLSIKNILQ